MLSNCDRPMTCEQRRAWGDDPPPDPQRYTDPIAYSLALSAWAARHPDA